jgi:outer membrane protein TolC
MENKWLFIVFMILLAAGRPVCAQTYSLRQILDSIDAHNSGLQQFALKTKASLAEADASKGWMAPTVGVGVSEFPYGGASKTANATAARKMLMLHLQQMFPDFSRQRREADYYRSFAAQDADDRATMKNMLFSRARMAYYQAYVAEKKLTVLGQQQKQLELLIQIAEGRLAYNKASLPDIYKARARLSDLKTMRIKISSTVEQSAAVINSLMDRAPDVPLQMDTAEDLPGEVGGILKVDSAYLSTRRSDIRHITDEVNTMTLQQKSASAMSKPVFGISWDNMRMPAGMGGENNGMYMFSAMATMSVPIAPWFSKGYKSRVRSIDFQKQAMQKRQDQLLRQALGNIRRDWLDLQSARKDLQLFNAEVIAAYAKAYQANLNAFSENTGDIFETLTAWNDLTTKRMEYYDKLRDMLILKVQLETEMQQY